jgi:isopenicillin N synthase-like dioxygenase
MMAAVLEPIPYHAADAPTRVVDALRGIGFAVLTDHPIPPDLVAEVHAGWYAFFASTAKHEYPATDRQDGFYPMHEAETAVGATVRDLKEFFHWYPWGQGPAELQQCSQRLYDLGSDVAAQVLAWVDAALPTSARDALSMPLPAMLDGATRTLLRIAHYPPLSGDEHPQAVRAAAHQDVNLITVLPTADAPGLAVLDRDGRWHTVPCDPGSVVVNVGDMLQLATQGWLPSTTHRVVNPPTAAANRSRLSTPLFLDAADDVELAPDVTAFAFLRQRVYDIRGVWIN